MCSPDLEMLTIPLICFLTLLLTFFYLGVGRPQKIILVHFKTKIKAKLNGIRPWCESNSPSTGRGPDNIPAWGLTSGLSDHSLFHRFRLDFVMMLFCYRGGLWKKKSDALFHDNIPLKTTSE